MEFFTFPFIMHPLDIRLLFTSAPGLYLAGGKSSTFEHMVGSSLKKKLLTSGLRKSIFVEKYASTSAMLLQYELILYPYIFLIFLYLTSTSFTKSYLPSSAAFSNISISWRLLMI